MVEEWLEKDKVEWRERDARVRLSAAALERECQCPFELRGQWTCARVGNKARNKRSCYWLLARQGVLAPVLGGTGNAWHHQTLAHGYQGTGARGQRL